MTIAVAAMGLFAISCSSDDEEEAITASIVGFWQVQAWPGIAAENVGQISEFTADGMMYMLDKKGERDIDFEYKLSGDKLTLTFHDGPNFTEITEYTIKKLNQTDMQISGMDKTSKKIITVSYKRIK